jgi:Flp pilus assembly protein TadG
LLIGQSGRPTSGAGQAYVEFILILPILFLLAVAVGDFGRVYASGVAVEDAAREAADYAAFDDINASHFSTPATDLTCTDPVCAIDSTRLEALRRACAAVSALPDFGSASNPTSVAAFCADSTARCSTTAGSFCQLLVEANYSDPPWDATCGQALPSGQAPQMDVTCGWTVHVTVTFDFHTALNFKPLPNIVHLVRESRYAISALPAGL